MWVPTSRDSVLVTKTSENDPSVESLPCDDVRRHQKRVRLGRRGDGMGARDDVLCLGCVRALRAIPDECRCTIGPSARQWVGRRIGFLVRGDARADLALGPRSSKTAVIPGAARRARRSRSSERTDGSSRAARAGGAASSQGVVPRANRCAGIDVGTVVDAVGARRDVRGLPRDSRPLEPGRRCHFASIGNATGVRRPARFQRAAALARSTAHDTRGVPTLFSPRGSRG